jgi:hypothetical protein
MRGGADSTGDIMNESSSFLAEQLRSWIGYTAYDVNGDTVGTIEDVYEDDRGSGPEWFAISTGWFGSRHSFAPVAGARAEGDRLVLPWTKDQIKAGPNYDAGDIDDGEHLYGHYGMDRGADTEPAGDAPELVRSEEELELSKRVRESGRARLQKWVVTENVQVTVPIRREVARLVTDDSSAAAAGAAGGAGFDPHQYDVVLRQVRIETDIVEEQRVVDEQVRRERIDVDTEQIPRDVS